MATVSTKRLRTRQKQLKKFEKAKKRREAARSASPGSKRRTLFFFNVPAWIDEFEEILEIFRPVSSKLAIWRVALGDHHFLFIFRTLSPMPAKVQRRGDGRGRNSTSTESVAHQNLPHFSCVCNALKKHF